MLFLILRIYIKVNYRNETIFNELSLSLTVVWLVRENVVQSVNNNVSSLHSHLRAQGIPLSLSLSLSVSTASQAVPR